MISVIVPVYNVSKYLRDCLTSIENQSYKDIEVIMVNDGSTDGSEKISREFAVKDKRFKLINQKNSGVCEARNRGIQESGGEYISFVDSDDTIEEDFLESLLEALVENNADMTQCDRRVNGVKQHPDWNTRIFKKNEIFFEYLNDAFFNSICPKMYKRDLIRNIPFPLERPIMEDASWTAHVLEQCNVVARIAEAKYDYRMVPSSLTHIKLSEKMECGRFRNVIEKAIVIGRNINEKESFDKLYDMVADFVPWILGSHDNLDMFDTYRALRFLINSLYKQEDNFEPFEIVMRNPNFRNAQDEYLWYELRSKRKNLKYKLNIIYRRLKRRNL